MSDAPPGTSGPTSWWMRPMAPALWILTVLVTAGWIVVRTLAEHLTQYDEVRQYEIVQTLASGHLRGAMTGISAQASPPGYGLFALPFHLAMQPFTPDGDGFLTAGWVALALLGIAAILALRSVGVPRRSPLEVFGLASITGASSTIDCFTESYHPAYLLATACVLFGATAVLRKRWGWAAAALGAGFLCEQWVIIAIVVLAVLVQGRGRMWIVVGSAAVVGIVVLPFLVTDPANTLRAISASTVAPTHRSLLSHLWFAHSRTSASLEARVSPLVVVAAICGWLARVRPRVDPAVVMTALAATMLVRPLLDPAGFVYYLTPGIPLLATSRPSWRWPTVAVVASLLVDAMAKPALDSGSLWPASAATLIMLALVVTALVSLATLMHRDRDPVVA